MLNIHHYYKIHVYIKIVKVRGPFVKNLCIEKDSYMDAI